MTPPDSASDLIPSSSPSPEPAGRTPASPWSLWSRWMAGDLDHLVVADRQLVWLSQSPDGGSVLWRLPLLDLGRTPPRALASFSSDLDYRWLDGQERREGDMCLTAYTMHRLIANAGWVYFDHLEGFARIPLTGGEPEVIAHIAPNDPRRVTSLAWIDGALWLAGWLDTDDASDPCDPYDPDDPNGAHDASRSRAFVARVEYGKASTRWEVPTRRWPSSSSRPPRSRGCIARTSAPGSSRRRARCRVTATSRSSTPSGSTVVEDRDSDGESAGLSAGLAVELTRQRFRPPPALVHEARAKA